MPIMVTIARGTGFLSAPSCAFDPAGSDCANETCKAERVIIVVTYNGGEIDRSDVTIARFINLRASGRTDG